MRNRLLQKRARTVRTLLKSLSANYRNGCPHITEKGVRELVKPAVQLLILDDFATHTLNDQQRFHLFEIIEERYQRRSTLITAQVPVNTWHDLIGDATVADAILDRVVHNAHRINLEGDSMRKAKSGIDAAPGFNHENN